MPIFTVHLLKNYGIYSAPAPQPEKNRQPKF